MKNFDSRTYSINDFLEWEKNSQLELSPKFQRRSVWTETARSYLMDTIIRGKPIPKFFIRQKLNTQTRTSVREVVDGQQRLRTILSYLKDGFKISKRHNETYGGMYYSELGQVDPEIQANLLNYELSVDLLVNMPDAEVLDVFGRLNSYAVLLNEQEKINAEHFGPFKMLVDRIAHSLYEFWLQGKILTEQQILRMYDVTMVADLLIMVLNGIKNKKQIKAYYGKYEKEFNYDTGALEEKLVRTISTIREIFGQELRSSEFRRNHLFYSLFTIVFHFLYGVENLSPVTAKLEPSRFARVRLQLEYIDRLFAESDLKSLEKEDVQFLTDCRRATTDGPVRIRRSERLIALVNQALH